MSWNLNSLAKDNSHRVNLIEAHNSLYNYDLISFCDTSLSDSVECDFSLPIVIRNDLSFDESIVIELKFGRKKVFSLSCIEVLPLITTLLIFKPFCQILEI